MPRTWIGTVTNVQFFHGTTNFLGENFLPPYGIVLTNVPVGSYSLSATATDNLGASGTSAPVSITVIASPPLSIVSPMSYNPQTDLFQETVRVSNPTPFTYDAARVYVYGLTNNTTVYNASGSTNGIPYVESQTMIAPGGYVDFVIEYWSPLRIMPNPTLVAELEGGGTGIIGGGGGTINGTQQHINQAVTLPDKTFLLEFASTSNRVYYVQYSSDLKTWKTAQSEITGNGTWIQWIDNGQPKTESAPATTTMRFYRVYRAALTNHSRSSIHLKPMKYIRNIQSVLTVVLLAAPRALAQSPSPDAVSPLKLEVPQAPSPNRFGLSYQMGFNAPVSFHTPVSVTSLPGYRAPSPARYTPDGDLYNYDNGYVLVDSSGNAMGYTRYWGYDNASQVSGNTIAMQKSSSAETMSSPEDHYDTPMSGFEITYNRELIHKDTWRGGLEAAFGYTYMSVQGGGTDSASVTRVKDIYTLPQGVYVVPSAPYTGSKSLPGPVIFASPSSSTTDITADSITGRDFSADLYNFRLGPYVEIPLSKRIAFSLSGGFALMYVNSEFSYNETVTIPGLGSGEQQPSGFGNGWLAGGYVAGTFSVALTDAWSLVAGAQFEDVGRIHPDPERKTGNPGLEQIHLRDRWPFLLLLT